MQLYTEILETQTLTESRALLLNNDKTALSCSSGSAFPTVNLQVGMLCFRTDQLKLYQLRDATPTWVQLLDLSDAGGAFVNKVAPNTIVKKEGGSEGGQLLLELPDTGSTLSGNVALDIVGNTLRMFESQGTARGAFLDFTLCSAGATSKLWHSSNDGTGSGLDADLLDGQHGSFYQNVGNMNAGTLAVARGGTGVTSSTGSGSVVLNTSPSFSGTPTAPTAAGGTNTTQLATTAFVQSALGTFGNSYVPRTGNVTLTNGLLYSGNVLGIGQNGGATRGYLYNDTGSFGLLNASGNWAVQLSIDNVNVYVYTNLTASGNITAFSDRRVKKNIEVIPYALSKLTSLSGYTFDRTDIEVPRQTGLIAQEVQAVLPEAILEKEDGTLSLAYGNMAGLFVEAIKELNNKVEALQAEITELKK